MSILIHVVCKKGKLSSTLQDDFDIYFFKSCITQMYFICPRRALFYLFKDMANEVMSETR